MASVQGGDIVPSSKATAIANTENATLFNVKTSLKEIVFGSGAGMVAELFEYPFDLAKVRLQAQLLVPSSSSNIAALRFNGPLHCLIQTWKEEGFRGLYRGLPVPIVGSMVETASVFVTYTFFQDAIRSLSPHERSQTTPLSISQLSLAAAAAGFVTSFALTPVELVKCKMQVQMMNIHPVLPFSTLQGRVPLRSTTVLSSLPAMHTSPSGRQSMHALASTGTTAAQTTKLPGIIEVTRSVISTEGFGGLWLGHAGTILRETGGCVAWFVSKEWVARQLLARRINDSQPNSSAHLLAWESGISGAIAGAVGALVCYPADTVKSAIQTEEDLLKTYSPVRSPRQRNTFLGTFRRMWAAHGLKGLYAGCGMTTARAIPSSGIIFVVYDKLSTWFT